MAATDSHNENVRQYTAWIALPLHSHTATFGIRCAIVGIWRPFLFFFFPSSRNLVCGMLAKCSNVTHVTYTRRAQRLNHEFYYIIHSAELRQPDINLRTKIHHNFHVTFYFSENIHKKIECENRNDRRYLVLGPFSRAGIYFHSQNARIPNGER